MERTIDARAWRSCKRDPTGESAESGTTFEPGPMPVAPIEWIPEAPAAAGDAGDGEVEAGVAEADPAALLLTCANCGAPMDERKCKLICRCGYFLSCSDYY